VDDELVKALILLEADYINGAAKTVLNLCDSINEIQRASSCRARFLISVAVFQRGELSGSSKLIEELHDRQIEVRTIYEGHRFDVRTLPAIRDLVKELKPDVIQTNSVKSHFLVAALRLYRGSRWIAFHHGYTTPDLKMQIYNQLDRWSLLLAERVVIPCDAFRDEILARGVSREQLRTIHNAACEMPEVASGELDLLSTRLNCDRETNVILTVGRLSSEKGHIYLVRAMARLRNSHPDLKVKLLLVGSGPEEHAIRAEIQELGLDSVVSLLCHEASVAAFYRLADIFVLPSLSEGSPNVILEAMVSGVPIIGTAVGGIPEMLKDSETALLVPPKRPDVLESAIVQVLDCPRLARGLAERAKAVARDRFSVEKYGFKVLESYYEVLDRPLRVLASHLGLS
jgi:glycosyltransferase involved in cell wall biosynthesis